MASAARTPSAKRAGFARFWRTLRQMFHELVGGVCAILALVWANAAVRGWSRDVAVWILAMVAAVALLMAYFSWTSFRRARRLR